MWWFAVLDGMVNGWWEVKYWVVPSLAAALGGGGLALLFWDLDIQILLLEFHGAELNDIDSSESTVSSSCLEQWSGQSVDDQVMHRRLERQVEKTRVADSWNLTTCHSPSSRRRAIPSSTSATRWPWPITHP
jgi:hypothetical protein